VTVHQTIKTSRTPMTQLREKFFIINMCLNETYSKICVGKHLSDTFPIQNGLKQGDAHYCCSILSLNIPSGKSKKIKSVWK
jgi:hypothetical protein